MKKAILVRTEMTGQGTFGYFIYPGGILKSGELPWKNNKPLISCIPESLYEVTWILSRKFGHCYQIQNVPRRTAIEFHPANFMGDKSQGYKSELQGCIALGKSIGFYPPRSTGLDDFIQKTLIDSKIAITKFQDYFKTEPFKLTIINNWE